ncbi:restriction endonuclease-related protein [Calidifontibacillus erzurumensis]|uniref:restriction endonuclease-related protein n=1 Tax=Calidifontibacillus erzurumensis TaxID=2741433 RepID=UPI0035B56D55
MESTYRMLYELISGFKKWEEKKDSIPESVYIGHRLFIKECSRNNIKPPTDLKELIKILELPSSEWGFNNLEKFFPPDASLLDSEIGVTIEAEDFLEEIHSPEEYEQSIMKKILIQCRNHKLDDTYCFIRKFLSQSKNAVIPYHELYECKGRINDQELVHVFSSCYEIIENLYQYRVCPYCGWTLEWKHGHWRCNKENVCHALADFQEVKEFPKTNNKMYRMRPGIQKYILLPGMSEHRIADRLRKMGCTIIFYPEIDKYDLKVICGSKEFYIDVKDYYNPRQLAMYINGKDISEEEKDLLYIVPDYRTKIFPKYQERVSSFLSDDRKRIVKILSETEAVRLIGGALNEENTI